MASPGKNWAQGSWAGGEWAKSWDFTYDTIGDDWALKAWGEGTWAPTAWYPTNLLNIIKQLLMLEDLTTGESTESVSAAVTLPTIQFLMNVGSILDLAKTLPVVEMNLTPVTLEVAQTGSVDANTLDVITLNLNPSQLIPGIKLSPITITFTPQPYDTIGLELPAVKVVFKSLIDAPNLTTTPTGLKSEHIKLIRRGKGLLRRSMAISQDDLINEIIDEVDTPDYRKDT